MTFMQKKGQKTRKRAYLKIGVFRIRIHYNADLDPAPFQAPFRSGSRSRRSKTKQEKISKRVSITINIFYSTTINVFLYFTVLISGTGCIYAFLPPGSGYLSSMQILQCDSGSETLFVIIKLLKFVLLSWKTNIIINK